MDPNNSARRRGVGYVTPNACTECRKKRTKCDGQTPCGRCASQRGIECIYEVPIRQSKEEMRKEISRLRARQRQTDRILTQLTSEEHSEQVLGQLRSGDTLEVITSRLRSSLSISPLVANVTTYSRAGDHQAIRRALAPAQNAANLPLPIQRFAGPHQMPLQDQRRSLPEVWTTWREGQVTSNEMLNNSSQHDEMNWAMDSTAPSNSGHNGPAVGVWHEQPTNPLFNSVIQSARDRGQDVILGGKPDSEELSGETKYATESWTTVTSDAELVEHLLALYFCWEYPIFASLSKEHFIEDFRCGVPRYCSSLLVNALLAIACRFSDRPSVRSDPKDGATAGNHFFGEALRLYEAEEDQRVLTTIQALGIMSIREASCGRVNESIFFSGQSIRLAMEMALHLDAEEGDDDESGDADEAVRAATFWGALSLDEAWSLCTGNLPFFSRKTSLLIKPAIIQRIESASWIPYTDDGGPLEQNCKQPSNIRSVYKTFCELSEIVHRTLYTLYIPGHHVTSKALLDAYGQYIIWYDTIPDTLRLGQNFTPAVLFAHLHYHLALLLLFRPFVGLNIIASDLSPRDVCTQASRAISAIIRSYSNLYTLRRTPSFVPYFALSTSIFHLVILHEDTSNASSKEQLLQNVRDLKEMSGCHGFATRALDIVRFLAYTWEIDKMFDGRLEGNDLKGAYHPSLVPDQCYPLMGAIGMTSHPSPRPSAFENPLFASFPIHGRLSMAVSAQALNEDGFIMNPDQGSG